MTAGCWVKPSAEATWPDIRTTRLIRSRLPSSCLAIAKAFNTVSFAASYPCSTVRSLPSFPAKTILPSLNGPVPLRKSKSPARTAGTYVATGFGAGGRVIFSSANLASNDISDNGHAGQARIVHECRSETQETEARRGFSQARVTQAYSLQYVEETEREKPRRARGS